MTYANDQNGLLPLYYSHSAPVNQRHWTETLALTYTYLPAKSDVYYCPLNKPATYEEARAASSHPLGLSYGMPLYGRVYDTEPEIKRFLLMVPSTATWTATPVVSHIVLPSIPNPSTTYLMADSVDGGNGFQASYVDDRNWRRAVHLRHDDGAHTYMADGSVSNKKAEYFRQPFHTWMVDKQLAPFK